MEQAHNLGYPIRYWWLSDAIEVESYMDRLIVCVHHPSTASDAGMDLYNALKDQQITWDDLEAAALDEYQSYGCPTDDILKIHYPNGLQLFPTTDDSMNG